MTIRVVIFTSVGGFSLPDITFERLIELGMKYIEIHPEEEKLIPKNIPIIKLSEKDPIFKFMYFKNDRFSTKKFHSDSRLIQAVIELMEQYPIYKGKFSIVKIPEDAGKWYINEIYDYGHEYIETDKNGRIC
jgi:hypothetical protein